MRRLVWTAIIAVVLGILFSLIGRAADARALYLLGGLGILVAIGCTIALLPVWSRLGLRLPRLGPLFPRVPPGQRWCSCCGQPTAKGVCVHCGAAGPDARKKP